MSSVDRHRPPWRVPRLLQSVALGSESSATEEASIAATNVDGQSQGGPFALDLEYSGEAVLPRLPRGRHGLPPGFIARNQRNRLFAAGVDSVSQRGYQATTIAHITANASVSRTTFYDHFTDKEACFLAAQDVVLDWLEAQVSTVAGKQDRWRDRVKAAVDCSLTLLAAEPRLVRLCAVEILFAGPAAAERRAAFVDRICVPLRAGRDGSPLGDQLPASLESALIGGSISLIARYVNAGRAHQLTELAPDLTQFLLAPYLGIVEARAMAMGG